jgi:hypothetical protein
MNKHFSKNRVISILVLLMLMIFLQCTSYSQGNSDSGKNPEKVNALSAEQTARIKTILSKYNASTLTADQAKEIHEKFRTAGIHPGPESKDAIIAAGFDPEKLRALAPPPDRAKDEGLKPPTLEERLKMVDEKIIKPLSLNTLQNETVREAFKDFFTEMDKLRQKQLNNPGPLEKSKVEPLEKSRDEKVKLVLSKDQFIKFQELEKTTRPPKPNDKEVKQN